MAAPEGSLGSRPRRIIQKLDLENAGSRVQNIGNKTQPAGELRFLQRL
jgi:hypothetical protein